MEQNGLSNIKTGKDYINYFFITRNKAYLVTVPLTFALCLGLLLLFETLWPIGRATELQSYICLVLELVTVATTTILSGWTVSALAVFVLFDVQVFLSNLNFMPFSLLVQVIAAYIPLKHGWYKSVWKTAVYSLLVVLVLSVVLIFVLWLTFEIWQQEGAIQILGTFFKNAIPVCINAVFAVCYTRFAPEKIQKLFLSSSLTSPEIREILLATKKQKRGTKISSRLTTIIVASTIYLTVCALGFGGGIFLPAISNGEQDWTRAWTLSQFFVCMVMNAIPAVLVSVIFTNTIVGNPLTLLSFAVQNTFEKELQAFSKLGEDEDFWQKKGMYVIPKATASVGNIELADLKLVSNNEIGIAYKTLVNMLILVREDLERIKREEKLKVQLAGAKASSKAKSDFLSNMSHEIRTPINAVLGLDEMILREATDQTIRSYASDIQSAGRTLLSLINDVLDFSKIEAGKMEIINADYDLSGTINDLLNMITARAEAKGLSFMVSVDEKIPYCLNGDETRIKQCALNILTNAVKYTKEGSVTLTVSAEPLTEVTGESTQKTAPLPQETDTLAEEILLRFTVRDTGIGIKSEDLEKLTQPFQRIEEKRNRSIEGTGLGMSIVNNLLTLMGSRLEVESVYGKGSTFSFAVRQRVAKREKMGDFYERHRRSAEEHRYEESFQAPSARILIVDDTPLNLTVAKGLLKKTRIQIDTASSGKAALKMALQTKYDVLYIDHLMPELDGIETLSKLRETKESQSFASPAIALTANAVSGAREMYLSKGFADYLSKPVSGEALEASLVKFLPKEKILHKGESGFIEDEVPHWDGVERRKTGGSVKTGSEADSFFTDLFALDIDAALKNCGGRNVFMEAAKNFYDDIDKKSALIEKYAECGDWKNYTVLVHALKSSARLIGAATLSEKARQLEALGDSVQKLETAGDVEKKNEYIAQIKKDTQNLLFDYKDYKARLSFLLGIPSTVQAQSTKPVISAQKVLEAFSALREVLSAFDFDTADSIIAELDGYLLPKEYAEQFVAVKNAVREVDAQKAQNLLNATFS